MDGNTCHGIGWQTMTRNREPAASGSSGFCNYFSESGMGLDGEASGGAIAVREGPSNSIGG